jgi:hypothetical protein
MSFEFKNLCGIILVLEINLGYERKGIKKEDTGTLVSKD